MRIAALILALLGIAGSGGLGIKWLNDYNNAPPAVREKANPELVRVVRGAYALIVCAVAGLGGAFLVFTRRGRMGGSILLACVAIPVVLTGNPQILVFTFCLAIAGIMALFVRQSLKGVPLQADHAAHHR